MATEGGRSTADTAPALFDVPAEAHDPVPALRAAVEAAARAVAVLRGEPDDADAELDHALDLAAEECPDDPAEALVFALQFLAGEAQEALDSSRPHEPSPCLDCGVDTTPDTPPGSRNQHWYMVRDAVWRAAGMTKEPVGDATRGGFLCVQCLEERLSRPLVARDLIRAPINAPGQHDDAPRLATLKAQAFTTWPQCCQQTIAYCRRHNRGVRQSLAEGLGPFEDVDMDEAYADALAAVAAWRGAP